MFNRAASTTENAAQTAANQASQATPSGVLNQIRSINSQQLTSAGIVAAEAIGFFTVGEMIGRLKLVGYRSSEHGREHH